MFSLVSGMYESYFSTPQLNILLLGAEGVGKTTLLERLKVTQFSSRPTQQQSSNNKRFACPAPSKYHKKDSDEMDRTWLDHKQQSSLEDVEWASNTENHNTRSTTNEERIENFNNKEYNLSPGHKMLPMEKIRPTSGQNLAKIDICGAKCHIFDIASGKGFMDLWERYYGDADAVIFCWKLFDANRNEEQRRILEMVRREIPDDVPILIFGHVYENDNTGMSCSSLPSMSTEVFLPNYHSNVMRVICGSAKNGKGVREAMEWFVPLAKRQAKSRAAQQEQLLAAAASSLEGR